MYLTHDSRKCLNYFEKIISMLKKQKSLPPRQTLSEEN